MNTGCSIYSYAISVVSIRTTSKAIFFIRWKQAKYTSQDKNLCSGDLAFIKHCICFVSPRQTIMICISRYLLYTIYIYSTCTFLYSNRCMYSSICNHHLKVRQPFIIYHSWGAWFESLNTCIVRRRWGEWGGRPPSPLEDSLPIWKGARGIMGLVAWSTITDAYWI